MPNAQLMAALHASTKALREMARDDATYDFVYAHKNMFVSNRETFKAAVAACQERSGRELLDRLDLQEICIEKVTEAELLHSCYYFVDSPLYKRFIQNVSKHGGTGTAIFVVNKRGIVVTNKYSLDAYVRVKHVLGSIGKLPDIMWAPVEDLKGFTFYN